MEKNNKPELDVEREKERALLKHLESAEELQDWLDLYLDLKFPMGTVYPASTHGPIDAMWEIYQLLKTGQSAECPQVTMLASRDSFKTLGAAALEVLLMLHFRLPVAHMAAIKSQSAKAIQYVNSFFRKLRPYLEANDWKKSSDSKTYIEWITDKNETVYLNIISCTIAGANCIHGTSLVKTDQGVFKARDLFKKLKNNENIKILSYNHTENRVEFKTITNQWETKHKELYEIKTTRGVIKVTGNHKIFVKGRGYVLAKDLVAGDRLYRRKGDRSYLSKKHGKRKSMDDIQQLLCKFDNIQLLGMEYKNNNTPLQLYCNIHGTFQRSFNKIQVSVGKKLNPCPFCNQKKAIDKQKLTNRDIRQQIHSNGFELVHMEPYTNAHDTLITLKCPQNHIFTITINNFRNNPHCTKCTANISAKQQEIYDYVKSIYDGDVIINDRVIIKPLELDIYVPDKKFGIEFDGLYWHSTKVRPKAKIQNKQKAALVRQNHINILCVFEDEWDDNNKKKLIKEMIKYRLGIRSPNVLRASKLEIRKLHKNKNFADFFNKFHLDGTTTTSFAYGLFYNNKMVSCMSFRKSFSDKCYEIARFANDYNYLIHGSGGRLIKNTMKLENIDTLITFSNNRLSLGAVYQKNGFKEITQTTEPSYYYTDFQTRIWRYRCKRINIPEIIEQYPSELAQAEGGVFSRKYLGHSKPLYRIYDYGHRKWQLKKK